MALNDILDKFFKLEELIGRQQSGSPEELSKTLDISKRQVLNYVRALEKHTKQQITYNRKLQSYVFKSAGVKKKVLDERP